MLDVSYDFLLVGASLAVALMAGFTGLSLTLGLSAQPPEARKLRIVIAAVVLGGGIWAMHFIAMLGIRLPIAFYYDTLTTLASALVAILLVGAALLALHFSRRTRATMALAGGLIAAGILSMHYIGMSGMRLCAPVYAPWGVAVAVSGGFVISLGVVWTAYSRRTQRNLLLGAGVFGLAVFSTHFLAMAGTGFRPAPGAAATGVPIDNAALAIGVALTSFMVCGGFLLMSVRLLPQAEAAEATPAAATNAVAEPEPEPGPEPEPVRAPYELEGRTHYVPQSEIAAVRAEGRYSILFVGERRLFCPWSISEVAKRLPTAGLVQTHRSYLINPAFVTGFERKKDSGYCYFEGVRSLDKAPVSRSRMSAVREILEA